ncbi:RNA polymerase sigma factor [Polaribacter sp. Hel_I_88]|uniref:RNA polymerase sigma factor n=1 Tax=Polaribacter sp. Hel_I_88 TaxID=1250006 RepID=UPI0034A1D61C
MQQCCEQDLGAQSKVYQLFAGKLFAVSLKYSKNYQDAEDNLQDSFLTIFDKIKQYNHKGSFEGWLKRITINTALKTYRRKTTLQIVKEVAENIENEEFDLEKTVFNVDVLLECLQQLPNQYRLVFNLFVLDDYSHKEIANLLNISIGTSKSNLSRARKILKEKLEIHQKEKNNGG